MHTIRRVEPSAFPTVGHEITATDYALIYGPLAAIAVVAVAMVVVLWRRGEARQKEHAAALERAARAELEQALAVADAGKEARADFFAQLAASEARHLEVTRTLTREAHEMTRSVVDKVTTELSAQRAVMEAALRRIGRRE